MILAAFDENIHTEILALVLVSTAFAWQTSTVAILVIVIKKAPPENLSFKFSLISLEFYLYLN